MDQVFSTISQYGAQGALGALLLAIIAVLIGGGAVARKSGKAAVPKPKPPATARVDRQIVHAQGAAVKADQTAAVQHDHVQTAMKDGEGLADEVNKRLHPGKRP